MLAVEKDGPVRPSRRQRDAPARWGARGQSLPDVQRLLRHSCPLLVLRTCVSRGRRRDVVVSQQQIRISDKREAFPAGAAEDALPAAGHLLKRISKAPNGHAYLYRNGAKGARCLPVVSGLALALQGLTWPVLQRPCSTSFTQRAGTQAGAALGLAVGQTVQRFKSTRSFR